MSHRRNSGGKVGNIQLQNKMAGRGIKMSDVWGVRWGMADWRAGRGVSSGLKIPSLCIFLTNFKHTLVGPIYYFAFLSILSFLSALSSTEYHRPKTMYKIKLPFYCTFSPREKDYLIKCLVHKGWRRAWTLILYYFCVMWL